MWQHTGAGGDAVGSGSGSGCGGCRGENGKGKVHDRVLVYVGGAVRGSQCSVGSLSPIHSATQAHMRRPAAAAAAAAHTPHPRSVQGRRPHAAVTGPPRHTCAPCTLAHGGGWRLIASPSTAAGEAAQARTSVRYGRSGRSALRPLAWAPGPAGAHTLAWGSGQGRAHTRRRVTRGTECRKPAHARQRHGRRARTRAGCWWAALPAAVDGDAMGRHPPPCARSGHTGGLGCDGPRHDGARAHPAVSKREREKGGEMGDVAELAARWRAQPGYGGVPTAQPIRG